jgi:hypothetical protein
MAAYDFILSADPTVLPGVAANVGTRAKYLNIVYEKTGTGNTDWADTRAIDKGLVPLRTSTLLAPAQTITLSSLDGDATGPWFIRWRIIIDPIQTLNNFFLHPDNIATNQQHFVIYYGSAGFGQANNTDGTIHANAGAGGFATGTIFMETLTGYARTARVLSQYKDAAATGMQDHSWFWTDTTTNIASIVLDGGNAGILLAGSVADLYRVRAASL